MPKREYYIRMPLTGIISRTIEAESEEEAVEKFFETTTFPSLETTSETDAEIEEWDYMKQIVQGNVFYGSMNEMEIEDWGEVEEGE